jgi:hypothetical protein
LFIELGLLPLHCPIADADLPRPSHIPWAFSGVRRIAASVAGSILARLSTSPAVLARSRPKRMRWRIMLCSNSAHAPVPDFPGHSDRRESANDSARLTERRALILGR